jgi:hypothetical protein
LSQVKIYSCNNFEVIRLKPKVRTAQSDEKQLESIYRAAFRRITKVPDDLKVQVEFYPYVGINSRIQTKKGAVRVRVSDTLRGAPIKFHQALANILTRKLLRKNASPEDNAIYRRFVSQTQIRDLANSRRRERGRKILTSSKGDHYHLGQIFELLNALYFRDSIPRPNLSWSSGLTFRALGHHDAAHEAIIVSKSLDSERVPRFVVEYVVFHEMLHIKHPPKIVGGRTHYHTKEFRRDERHFAYFEEAENWVSKNAHRFRRVVRKRPKQTK